MDALTLALVTGLGWTSGLRFYAVLFFLGLAHRSGIHALPGNLEVLANPWVLSISGLLFVLEFLADKIPGVDSLWDIVNTFVRIPGGALLAAAAVAGNDPGLGLAAGLLGGTMAAGAHLTKASTRALINTSPEPISNWTASFTEDALSLGALWIMLKYPLLLLGLLSLFVFVAAWLLPRIWRGLQRIRTMLRRIAGGT